MVTSIAISPATAQINCLERNAYGEPKRSRAITAEAENTITSPTNTSSMVTANSQRSTLTRFAMRHSFHHGVFWKIVVCDFCVLPILVRGDAGSQSSV